MKSELTKAKSYVDFLKVLKEKIRISRVKAALNVNAQKLFGDKPKPAFYSSRLPSRVKHRLDPIFLVHF